MPLKTRLAEFRFVLLLWALLPLLHPGNAIAAGESPGSAIAAGRSHAPDPGFEPSVRLLGQVSLSAYDGSSWIGGGLLFEGRVAGAVWFSSGAGLQSRPKSQNTTSAGHLTVPAQFGFRRVANLPGDLELRGGGDFLLIFEAALETALEEPEAERKIAVRPGGLLEMGLTLPLARTLDLELSVSLGAVIREQPSEVLGLPPLVGPALRFQLSVGLRWDLAPKRSRGTLPS